MGSYILLEPNLSSAKTSTEKILIQDLKTSTDAINKILDENKEVNKSTDLFGPNQTEYIANEPAGPRVFEVSTTLNSRKISTFSTESFLEQKKSDTVHTSSVVSKNRKDVTNHGFEMAFGNIKSTSMNLDVVEISSRTPKIPLDTTFDYPPADPETQTVNEINFLKSSLHKKSPRKSSTMRNIINTEPDEALIPTKPAFPFIGNTL